MEAEGKITITEAAQRLGVNRPVIVRLIHQGRLAAYRVLGRNCLLVEEADLAAVAEPVPVHNLVREVQTVSISEAAAALRCRKQSVRELIASGDLKALHVPGGRERVRVDSLTAYLAGGTDFIDDEVAS